MNSLYWLVTITDRRSTDAFLALYEEHGITVSLRTVGAGTAVPEPTVRKLTVTPNSAYRARKASVERRSVMVTSQ